MDESERRRHDKSWNDPPLFSYDQLNQGQNAATGSKLPLSKRYRYPTADGGQQVDTPANPMLQQQQAAYHNQPSQMQHQQSHMNQMNQFPGPPGGAMSQTHHNQGFQGPPAPQYGLPGQGYPGQPGQGYADFSNGAATGFSGNQPGPPPPNQYPAYAQQPRPDFNPQTQYVPPITPKSYPQQQQQPAPMYSQQQFGHNQQQMQPNQPPASQYGQNFGAPPPAAGFYQYGPR